MARQPQRGDVAVVPFPFTDLSESKPRPALIVAASTRNDFIVAFITSQSLPISFDNVALDPADPEFDRTGLATRSTIRLSRLTTLNSAVFLSRVGTIGPSTQARVSSALRLVLQL